MRWYHYLILAILTLAVFAPQISKAGDCSSFFGCQQAVVQQQHVQAFAVPQYQFQAIQQPVILQQRAYVQQPVILRQQAHHVHRVQVQRFKVQAVRQPQVIVNQRGLLGRRSQVTVR